MKKVLAYTFRTCPFLQDLQAIFPDIIVLHQLKNDLGYLYEKILAERPSLIIGIAHATSGKSTFEKFTANRFHGTKKVANSNVELLELTAPKKGTFAIRSKPTQSFCNYSMFSVALFLEENHFDIPFMFTHIKRDDINSLESVFPPFL